MIAEQLQVHGTRYDVRPARREAIPAVVALLADDVLGRRREAGDADLAPYIRAFDLIASHPNQELIVVERAGEIVGTLDIAVLPSLSRRGSVRVQVEAVRIAAAERGSGLGSALFRMLIDWSRRQGYDLLQLTSDRTREDAHAFYERLGFTASHLGYKLDLRE
jgi:GNAT superfamily N-acetyltransferase